GYAYLGAMLGQRGAAPTDMVIDAAGGIVGGTVGDVSLALSGYAAVRGLFGAATGFARGGFANAPRRGTGGTATWQWGRGAIPEAQAEAAYEAIRQSTTDVAAISRYTGLKADRLARIKEYLFNNPEWTGADNEIAAAWHRLRTGAGTSTDKLLLKHETAEMWLRARTEPSYLSAHTRANRKWNWQKAIEEPEPR